MLLNNDNYVCIMRLKKYKYALKIYTYILVFLLKTFIYSNILYYIYT